MCYYMYNIIFQFLNSMIDDYKSTHTHTQKELTLKSQKINSVLHAPKQSVTFKSIYCIKMMALHISVDKYITVIYTTICITVRPLYIIDTLVYVDTV